MAQPLTPRRPGRAVTKFSNRVMLVGGAGLCALVIGAMLLPTFWRSAPIVAVKESPPEQSLKLPEVISRPLAPRLPVAAPAIVQDQAPMAQSSPPVTSIDAGNSGGQPGLLDRINPFPAKDTPTQQAPQASPALPAARAPQPQPPSRETKPKKGWAMLAMKTTDTTTTPGASVLTEQATRQGQESRQENLGQNLIHPARWAIPENPLKTIYRSQTLTCRLLQAINSDIPGQVKCQLTTPVLDKFGYDTEILPKETLVIASQESRPAYGNTRLALKIEQLELPTGEVVDIRATVGDEAGANGLKGKVNNHYGKQILGVGLSALLNIGVRSATGTPGQNQFFRNPLQDAAQDVGQSVQQSASAAITREMQVLPTITVPVGTFCTISLSENMQFHRAPLVAR